MTLADRFWAKVDKTPYCWQWTAYISTTGYGRFQLHPGKPVPAHRFAYEQLVGPIPAGLDLDHLCRNRACVRPDHLEPVPRRTNLLRGKTIPAANIGKTHCPHGHEYTTENTRWFDNARQCRACARTYDHVRHDWQGGVHQRERMQCPRGHVYDGLNSQGRRICRECQRAAQRRYRERRQS